MLHYISTLAACILACSSNVLNAAPIDLNDGQHTIHLVGAPKRVIVLEFSFLDSLAAIDVMPIGIADDGAANRVLPSAYKAIGQWESVGLRSQPNIEKIARLKPDLILADLNRHQALYDHLSSIAPTLLLPSRSEDYQGSLKSAKLIGKALGKSLQMDARIAQNCEHLKAIAQQIPAGTSVLFGVAREDSFSVHGQDSYAGSVLKTIGLKVSSVSAKAVPTEFISLEQLLALDPGWLLVSHYRRPSIIDTWSKLPLWQVLSAVRNHQVAEVNGDNWARHRGVLASEQIAEDALVILKNGKAVLSY
ncbi:Fe(3+) dicitrate ABC transporter substrate-binding protein [Candidatus Pseudomonas adelgestsugas]|nr:Fe(3+) dicitrate ABC transporter substrate-binding protein [Candidatus Pseudomonas adelgestsugas]